MSAEFKRKGNELRDRHGYLVAKLDDKYIRDAHGYKVGSIDGKYIRDGHSYKIAQLDGDYVRDAHGYKIANTREVVEDIDGTTGGIGDVAFWLLFVR